VKKLDKLDAKLYRQENDKQTITDQELLDLKESVDSGYNNLQVGDNMLRDFN